MSSLTTCIKKAGSALRAEDKSALLARARELRAEGMKADDAGRQAISEQLEAVRAAMPGPEVLNQGADKPLAQISLPESFATSPAVISLLEGANLSSFIHESGHLFLEIQADLAMRIQAQISEGASASDGERAVLDDMNRLLGWFDVKGDESTSPLEAWGRMTLDEKRASHEKFAEGFEKFAMEGNAPSLDLQGVFQQFRSWLVRVYQNLRSLNVDLNDDVRAVMGRMLATDQAIEEAEAQRNMGALFKTLETSGMTLEEYSAYQADTGGAVAGAQTELQTRAMKDMRWLSRAHDRALKARQKEVEEQRREVRQEVRGEVLREPVYRAWQFLTGKVSEVDKVDPVEQPKSKAGPVDNTVDSMFVAIAKMGGLRRGADSADLGIDPKQRSPQPMFGKALMYRDAGLSLDAMAERLGEEGYLTLDENGKVDIAEFQEKFQDELRGVKQYSYAKDYAAAQAVAAGTGLNVAAMQSGKLDLGSLIDQYGPADEKIAKLKARRMTGKVGIDPGMVADNFEFDSGDAMVRALADATPPNEEIEIRTDERMMQMFGDITSPEALARAADEAVHNELRVRVLTREWQALQSANKVREDTGTKNAKGQKRTVDVLARAAKQYATETIARLRVRDIRPGQYAASGARNGRMAEQAFIAGKLDEAAMHKRNQIVNVYATKAAYDAQTEVKAAQVYFRKFDKRIKGIDLEYQEQIDAILERFDFKPASLKAIDKRKSLVQFIEGCPDAVPSIPPELLNEANRKSYKDMTVEELRGLRETVTQIEHLGRLKNKLLLAHDKREFEDIRAEIVRAIIASKGGKRRPYKLESAPPTFGDTLTGFLAEHRKLSSYIREIDHGDVNGPMYTTVGRSMNTQDAWENERQQKATKRLLELFDPLLAMPGGMTGDKSKLRIDEIGTSMTRAGRLSVVMNWGNADGRARLQSGNLMEGVSNWTEGQVQAIMKTLTAKELQQANEIWAALDEFWPEISDKHYRINGVRLEGVDAVPFTVKSSDGVDVQMRGGYYPLKYDSGESPGVGAKDAAEAAKDMMRGAATSATTKRGHEKARVEGVKYKLRLDMNVVGEHIQDVIHDLAWHEWLIDANKVFRDAEIAQTLSDYYGKDVLNNIKGALEAIAGGDKVVRDNTTKIALMARSNVSRAVMGFSAATAFLQPFGLMNSMPKLGVGNVLRAVGQWVGDGVKMESTVAKIAAKSPMMRNRAQSMNRELYEISHLINGKSKGMRMADAALFFFTTKMQMVADVPTWLAAYNKSLQESPQDEQIAIDQADRAVVEFQGSGSTKDLAKVQRDHPFMTQFMSYFSAAYQQMTEQTKTTDFKNPVAVAGWMGDMALLAVLPAILPSLLMHALRGGDDEPEELAKKMAVWQAQYLVASIVYVRELGGLIGGFDYAGPPAARILNDAGKLAKQAWQWEFDEPLVKAMVNLFGDVTGFPTTQLLRSYKGWKAWDEGEEGAGPQAVLIGPPPRD